MKQLEIDIEKKRKREQEIVEKMIEIYCRKKHKKESLCEECSNLLEYTRQRSNNCPLIEVKTFCASCKIHCYKKDMKDKIKEVMKFSGKRLIFYYPKDVLLHIIDTIKNRKSNKDKNIK